jgi:Flp pilus assembly pilin Flp
MIDAINNKAIQLYAWLSSERGQTSAEYTAVTAAGVGIAIAVIYGVLRTQINNAIVEIGNQLTSAIPFS